MVDFVEQNAILALLTALVLQGLKNWQAFSWLRVPHGSDDKTAERVNRLVSIFAAGLVTLGIHYTWHYDAHTGAFDVGFSGTLAGLRAGLFEWVKQWAATHGAYKTVVVLPELLGNMNNLLLRMEQQSGGGQK